MAVQKSPELSSPQALRSARASVTFSLLFSADANRTALMSHVIIALYQYYCRIRAFSSPNPGSATDRQSHEDHSQHCNLLPKRACSTSRCHPIHPTFNPLSGHAHLSRARRISCHFAVMCNIISLHVTWCYPPHLPRSQIRKRMAFHDKTYFCGPSWEVLVTRRQE